MKFPRRMKKLIQKRNGYNTSILQALWVDSCTFVGPCVWLHVYKIVHMKKKCYLKPGQVRQGFTVWPRLVWDSLYSLHWPKLLKLQPQSPKCRYYTCALPYSPKVWLWYRHRIRGFFSVMCRNNPLTGIHKPAFLPHSCVRLPSFLPFLSDFSFISLWFWEVCLFLGFSTFWVDGRKGSASTLLRVTTVAPWRMVRMWQCYVTNLSLPLNICG